MVEAPALKPRMRGRLHQVAFFVSLPLGGALIAAAESAAARVSSAIYAVTLSGLYAASAAFHRIPWAPRTWTWMRKLDHSMIFLLIAGTYTPYALLVLPPPWSTIVLTVVWAGAIGGVVARLITQQLAWLQQTLYLVLGWTALLTLPLMISRLSVTGIILMFTGGLFYTVGAILFRLGKPNPSPTVFGYHEVWHSMVIGGSVCHYILILSIVLKS